MADVSVDATLQAEQPDTTLAPLKADGDQHLFVEVDRLSGTWGYAGGTDGTPSLPAGSLVIALSAIATSAGATITIDGGDAIPVPTDVGVTLEPHGNVTAPTVVFTGTASYFVEYLT